jgi:predicted lipoprotein
MLFPALGRLLGGTLLAGALASAQAQQVAANVAIPFYSPQAFMQGVYKDWYAPRAQDFAAKAASLTASLGTLCAADAGGTDAALAQARSTWRDAALAWDRLAAVAIGPVVKRRSIRQIDFTPTRPELIARSIRTAPADVKALERVGTPAKGLPALEWLLWGTPVAAAGSPACRYAGLLAADGQAEADALATSFTALSGPDAVPDDESTEQSMSELINQWVGGLERLRWPAMEKPLRSAGKGKPPAYPRATSGATGAVWAAQWEGLRTLAVAQGRAAPVPGEGLAPLETYLRGRGLNPLADRWAATVVSTDRAIAAATPGDAASVLAAAKSVASLKRLAEADLAPALEVNLGFSDADGD